MVKFLLNEEINFSPNQDEQQLNSALWGLASFTSSERLYYAVIESWFLVVLKRAEEQRRKGQCIFWGAVLWPIDSNFSGLKCS